MLTRSVLVSSSVWLFCHSYVRSTMYALFYWVSNIYRPIVLCDYGSIYYGRYIPLYVKDRQCFVQVQTTVEDIQFEATGETSAKSYSLHLHPALAFRNLLPLPVTYTLEVHGATSYKTYCSLLKISRLLSTIIKFFIINTPASSVQDILLMTEINGREI